MPQPRDPARASSAPRQTKKTADPAHRPRPPQGPIAAREWDVAHAAALRALLTQSPAVLPNQVGDPLLPLQIGIRDALLPLLRPGAEPEALARALRAYTRSTGYFMACARKDAMRHDLDARAVEPVSEEHRTGAVKAVQGRRRRSAGFCQDSRQKVSPELDEANRGHAASKMASTVTVLRRRSSLS